MNEPTDPAQELYLKRNKSLDIQREVDPFATWAFYLPIAILGIAFVPILNLLATFVPIVSIILGTIALYRIQNNKKLKGTGFALMGIILSTLEIIVAFALLYILLTIN